MDKLFKIHEEKIEIMDKIDRSAKISIITSVLTIGFILISLLTISIILL